MSRKIAACCASSFDSEVLVSAFALSLSSRARPFLGRRGTCCSPGTVDISHTASTENHADQFLRRGAACCARCGATHNCGSARFAQKNHWRGGGIGGEDLTWFGSNPSSH